MPPLIESQLTDELRTLPLFADLDESQFGRAVVGSQRVSLAADETLFQQGQTANRFYLVRSGFMKLSRLSPAGEEKVIEFLHPGHTFAEALMFAGTASYPVTARALEPSEVIGFNNENFMGLLRESPDTCLRLLANMSRRVHGLLAEIDRLALQSATSRVVGYLLAEAVQGQVELRTPKHVLASRLSITPETLSRLFARLAGSGLIRVRGTRIDLLRMDALRRVVDTGE